jgi:hypothetical protein
MPLSLTAKRGRIKINMTCIPIGKDLIITLSGGDRKHIGSIAVGQIRNDSVNGYNANISNITIPTHKEKELACWLAHVFTTKLNITSCIICGIHVEQILKSEIQDVIEMSIELANQLITQLVTTGKS